MAYFGLLRIMIGDLGWWGLIQGFPLKDIKNKKDRAMCLTLVQCL